MHPILGTPLPCMTVVTAISTFFPLIVHCTRSSKSLIVKYSHPDQRTTECPLATTIYSHVSPIAKITTGTWRGDSCSPIALDTRATKLPSKSKPFFILTKSTTRSSLLSKLLQPSHTLLFVEMSQQSHTFHFLSLQLRSKWNVQAKNWVQNESKEGKSVKKGKRADQLQRYNYLPSKYNSIWIGGAIVTVKHYKASFTVNNATVAMAPDAFGFFKVLWCLPPFSSSKRHRQGNALVYTSSPSSYKHSPSSE